MRQAQLIVVTGLPGTGKSTLARLIAERYRFALICKDTIKEPLLDTFGSGTRADSRGLSDASFAILFSLARGCVAAGVDLVLEGNFRPGEHEPALRSLTDSIAQVICRAAEPVRLARLRARANDPSRHPGHRDATLATEQPISMADTLALPGEPFVFNTDAVTSIADGMALVNPLLLALDQWRTWKS